ncbi:MAG TPA: DNA-processing protein DprA [Patescibacteria group bacterium]
MEVILSALLSRYCHFYNVKLFELVKVYDTLESLYAIWLTNPVSLPINLCRQLEVAWKETYKVEMQEQLHKHAIRGLLFNNQEYPDMLRHISDPPYVLYVRGNSDVLSNVCLACVGTRRMSGYGKRAISRLLSALSHYSLCIVSGLALGVDGEAHRVALESDLLTVAVLAAGLDRFEPTTNAPLAERIITQGGCLLSEYPPGVRPQKHHFLERNRIVAGISAATLIIEGKEHSGSLVTARYALANGREVGVVPGDIFLENTQGPLRLLRDGAWPIAEVGDILNMLSLDVVSQPISDEVLGEVAMALRAGPVSLDGLCEKLNWPIGQVQAELTRLELEGAVECLATGAYYLKR